MRWFFELIAEARLSQRLHQWPYKWRHGRVDEQTLQVVGSVVSVVLKPSESCVVLSYRAATVQVAALLLLAVM